MSLDHNSVTFQGSRLFFIIDKPVSEFKYAHNFIMLTAPNLLQIETCSQQEVELQRNLEVMKEKIYALKAEKIAAIEERATKKVL